MTTGEIFGLSLALFVMLIGILGCLLPVLPGTPIILAAAIGHKIFFGSEGAGWIVLTILTLFTLISLVLDQAASMIGAKKLGATWKGVTGAVVGGIVGLFFSIPGILLGPFVGATLFELVGDREFKDAAKAGAGATIGLLVGTVGKTAIGIVMTLLFAVNVVQRSLN